MPTRPKKPREELIFEEDEVAPGGSNQNPDDEFEVEDDDEFEVDEEENSFIKSRRNLLLGVLAAVAAGVTGYAVLHENGPGGEELMKEYGEMVDSNARHKYVLKQIAAGNMPSSSTDFVTIEVKGKKGKVLTFDVSPHGLRIGHNNDYIEVPLDGPHALAACEIQGLTLPTKWMCGKVRDQAFKTDGKVRFVAEPEIKLAEGEQSTAHESQDLMFWKRKGPDGVEMMSSQFVKTRNWLLKKWRADHNIADDQLTSGYFKEIVQDSAHPTKVSTYPGYLEEKQQNGKVRVTLLYADLHEATYYDYSHLVRCVRPQMKVDGTPMSFTEFFSSRENQKEFGFETTEIKPAPYKYTPDLAKFVEDNK